MHLFSLTLQKSSSITNAVYGNFSAPRQQELILLRGGRVLELPRPDQQKGRSDRRKRRSKSSGKGGDTVHV